MTLLNFCVSLLVRSLEHFNRLRHILQQHPSRFPGTIFLVPKPINKILFLIFWDLRLAFSQKPCDEIPLSCTFPSFTRPNPHCFACCACPCMWKHRMRR